MIPPQPEFTNPDANSLSVPFTQRQLLWASLGAVLVLLLAWLVPLPKVVSGEDDLAKMRVPQTSERVEQTRRTFEESEKAYKSFVASTDVTAALAHLEVMADKLGTEDPSGERLREVVRAYEPVQAYMAVLERYATTGEQHFEALQALDRDLMAWTRSLGPKLERLRRATWPIADHLRLYPPPVGDIAADPPWMTAAQVTTNATLLNGNATSLSAKPQDRASVARAAQLVKHDIANVRASGRSIERIAGQHGRYYEVLSTYKGHIEKVAAQDVSVPPQGGPIMANTLNLIMGGILVVGLSALFAPKRGEKL